MRRRAPPSVLACRHPPAPTAAGSARTWAEPGACETGGEMTALPLVFDPPRRSRPPQHLADLAPPQRRAAVAELGHPGYRADQLARHYFARLSADPEHMTDVPAAVRGPLAEALLPALLSPVRQVACDGGATRKTLWRGHDGTLL